MGGRYRLERLLASGGMGAVWAARHLELNIDLAIKFRSEAGPANARSEWRFRREAQLAAQLRSPYIVPVYDFGVDHGQQYLVMDLLKGEDLKARLQREGTLSIAQTSRLLTQAAKGLTCAHEVGIVHRDLKPGNLFLALSGNEEILTILDFGIAVHHQCPSLDDTTTGVVVGSPSYMSPEQAQGETVTLGTDLWSLAVVAYQAITGAHPFKGKNYVDTMQRICSARFLRPSRVTKSVPRAFDAFFDKAFAVNHERRFRTALELERAFAKLAEHCTTSLSTAWPPVSLTTDAVRPASTTERSWRSSATRSRSSSAAGSGKARLGAVVISGITLSAMIGFYFISINAEDSAPPVSGFARAAGGAAIPNVAAGLKVESELGTHRDVTAELKVENELDASLQTEGSTASSPASSTVTSNRNNVAPTTSNPKSPPARLKPAQLPQESHYRRDPLFGLPTREDPNLQ